MYLWIGFFSFVALFLVLDLAVFNRKHHRISFREAGLWSSFWVVLGLAFTFLVFAAYGRGWVENPNALSPSQASLKYVTAYLVELSLSMDNIFVMAVIFSSFGIQPEYQHKVLFWGILGAIVFRFLAILFGVALIKQFDWIIYVFGAFILFTGIKLFFARDERKLSLEKNPIFRLVKRFFVVTSHQSPQFFIKRMDVLMATPTFLALVIIEFTDLLFAVDSIPAVLAITTDTFLVFTSNIMAIMGLRSMYFFLGNMATAFRYFKYSLACILVFVGVKLCLSHYVHMPEWLSLGFILIALALGIILSKWSNKNKPL
ncbi:TerC/Alx family metal homeostasis membrane protein [Flagellimonas meishanensis]|uniref:TerC/Alx family metal homeostasis membrane protein n=1 Tax=Flagellimonas meishanensis TaxID=2873264 RepID=UPI001CA72BFA|nr:TerC/Alx family metal homeostasis membrane protein [[Muricauda] meishanensis]